MNIILKKPLISEKSMKLTERNLYTFLVDKSARKVEIAKVVESRFGVDVLAVKTATRKEDNKRQRGRRKNFIVSGYKKALVQLKTGQKIDLFETEVAEGTVTTADSKQTEKKEVKEKKSLLRGTKVKIERGTKVESKKGKTKEKGEE